MAQDKKDTWLDKLTRAAESVTEARWAARGLSQCLGDVGLTLAAEDAQALEVLLQAAIKELKRGTHDAVMESSHRASEASKNLVAGVMAGGKLARRHAADA